MKKMLPKIKNDKQYKVHVVYGHWFFGTIRTVKYITGEELRRLKRNKSASVLGYEEYNDQE